MGRTLLIVTLLLLLVGAVLCAACLAGVHGIPIGRIPVRIEIRNAGDVAGTRFVRRWETRYPTGGRGMISLGSRGRRTLDDPAEVTGDLVASTLARRVWGLLPQERYHASVWREGGVPFVELWPGATQTDCPQMEGTAPARFVATAGRLVRCLAYPEDAESIEVVLDLAPFNRVGVLRADGRSLGSTLGLMDDEAIRLKLWGKRIRPADPNGEHPVEGALVALVLTDAAMRAIVGDIPGGMIVLSREQWERMGAVAAREAAPWGLAFEDGWLQLRAPSAAAPSRLVVGAIGEGDTVTEVLPVRVEVDEEH